MAILDFDGMDDYAGSADACLGKYTSWDHGGFFGGGSAPVLGSTTGRFGASGIICNSAGAGSGYSYLNKVFGANYSTLIWSASFNPQSYPSGAIGGIVELWDGTTPQLAIAIDAGRIYAYRGRTAYLVGSGGNPISGTLLGYGSHAIPVGTWHRIEVKVTFNGSTGIVVVRIDGVNTVLNLTAQNTSNSGNNFANSVRFGASAQDSSSISVIYDDPVWQDDSGPAPYNDMIGDRKIATKSLNGDSSVAWTPDSGANNYSRINEAHEDGDSSYVEASVAAKTDLYTTTPLPANIASPDCIKVNIIARKTDVGSRDVEIGVRSGGVDDLSSAVGVTMNYAYFNHISMQNPNGPAAWTNATIDAALPEAVST